MIKYIGYILILFLYSCNNNKETIEEVADATFAESSPLAKSSVQYTPPKIIEENQSIERKIVKTGSLSFKTNNPKEKIELLTKELKNKNGYIVSTSNNNDSYSINYNLSVKIPVEKIDQFILYTENYCGTLISKEVNTQDVTEEFIDNNARLKTKKLLEERYFSLLSQTKKVSEIIEVEEKLNEVRSDIESLEGRQKFLSQNTSYSQLFITFYSNESILKKGGNQFSQAIIDSIGTLFEYLLILIKILPSLLFTTLILLGIYRIYKKYKKEK